MNTEQEHPSDAPENTALARVESALPAPTEQYREAITPAQARIESVAAALDTAYKNASLLKLTPEEQEGLAADFPDEAFRLGAGGDDRLLYLEHAYLRQRLNQVLGIGSVVPIRRREWAEEFQYFKDNKNKTGVRVYVDLVLIVRGCVVGEAIGDAIYYPDNAKQNYSDALESAKSNAFRRCCKEFGVGLQPWMKGFCEGWQLRKNTQNRSQGSQYQQTTQAPRQYQKPAPQANQERKPASSGDVLPKIASEARRDQVWKYLYGQFQEQELHAYFDSRGWHQNNWPLKDVPASNQELTVLINEINAFIASQTQQTQGSDVSRQMDTDADGLPESIANSIITVPRRGMKRDEYLQNPDTIGSLYRAMKDGDADAGKRLWGMARGWNPEPYVGAGGKKYPVSKEDAQCRIDLDTFVDWYENNNKEEGGGNE